MKNCLLVLAALALAGAAAADPIKFARHPHVANGRIASGFDRELKAAVDETLRMLKDSKFQYLTTTSSQQGDGK